MIVNGVDIVGYDWVKFVKSNKVNHVIEGKDIILYGNNSTDFSYLFKIVKSVPITDSEYIDVTPGVISKIGSVSVQSNTVDPVLFNVILTDTEETKVIVSNLSVMIICNIEDKDTINLGAISDQICILNIAKDYGKSLGNIKNATIMKDVKLDNQFYNSTIYTLNNCFYTNMNYTRALNRLNAEIIKLMPEFDFKLGKIDEIKSKPNSIYCNYSQLEIIHHKFFMKLRRNMMHKLPVNYEIIVADDIKYARYMYEMSNYDFLTNICELTVNDDNDDIPWTFAIHWEVEPFEIDLIDPKTGNQNVSRSIKLIANLYLFTSIDNWVSCLKHKKDEVIEKVEFGYFACSNEKRIVHEVAIATADYIINN